MAGTNDLDASSAVRPENPTDISPIQPSKPFNANNPDSLSNVSTCPATYSTSISTVGSAVDIEPDGGRITATAVDPDPISYLNLSQNVLEHLLNEFRSRQAFYPFVVVSPEWTVPSMIAERPFLFLATITNASSRYPQLQQSLVSTFKETLARRVIVAGDRDLDVLQGILVHLAWYSSFRP